MSFLYIVLAFLYISVHKNTVIQKCLGLKAYISLKASTNLYSICLYIYGLDADRGSDFKIVKVI